MLCAVQDVTDIMFVRHPAYSDYPDILTHIGAILFSFRLIIRGIRLIVQQIYGCIQIDKYICRRTIGDAKKNFFRLKLKCIISEPVGVQIGSEIKNCPETICVCCCQSAFKLSGYYIFN